MRAAWYERVGPAREVLTVGELPDPQPAAGEVRVRVLWSGVNPSDVKSRAGLRNRTLAFAQVVPHSDGMGVIDSIGPGVVGRCVGERVWLWNAAWGRPWGTAAEYVCLLQQMAVPLPEDVDDKVGACLGIPAMTATHAVLMDGGVAGKTVLVAAGAGAVGHYAVQIAVRMGAAKVIATVSTPVKAALALAAGADEVIYYKTENVVDRVRELTAGGVDRVIEMDIATNGASDMELLKPNGDCIAYGSSPAAMNLPFPTLLSKNIQVRFFMVYHLRDDDRRRAQGALQRMLVRGGLTHNIPHEFALERIVDAHELIESGRAMGNVALKVC